MSDRVMRQDDAEDIAAALAALNDGLLKGIAGAKAWPEGLRAQRVEVRGRDGMALGHLVYYSHESIDEWRFAPNGYVSEPAG